MKTNPPSRPRFARLAAALTALALLASAPVASAQTVLPNNVQQSCTLTPAQFAKWFWSGSVTPNGAVMPANSLTFPNGGACDFYQWSAQMFLWLNSATSNTGGRVFDSPLFYGVSTATNGVRTLIPNQPGVLRKLALRTGQVGKNGKLLRVAANGTVSEVEQGQAGGNDVLMAQNGSLVYYTIDVNDVYAWLVTGTTGGGIQPPPTTFPVNAAQLLPIVTLAGKNGAVLPDATALAIELKTSWVDASTVDASKYVTMPAEIPTYDTSNPQKWVPNGTKTALLAMVGMHIVGSAAGHPEMIWATYEHIGNTPNGAYAYVNNAGATVQVPQSTAGNWLFCASNFSGTANTPNMAVASDGSGSIVAKTTTTNIVPSNTVRTNPWGGATDATNNSMIISLNQAVLGMLGAGDVRKNYLLVGATWTVGGVIPGNTPPAVTAGSLTLANSTMETYHQNLNCFACHQGTSFGADDLSHIFSTIKPLPTK